MHPQFQHLMKEAARLTRSGDLAAATAIIQTALRTDSAEHSRHGDSDVIDVEAWEIPDPAQAQPKAPASTAWVRETASRSRPSTPRIQGDVFIEGAYRNASGRRSYKLYVPPCVTDQPLPLVVMLHGCTQDADDFAAGTAMNDAARERGFYVLYPTQSHDANPQKCWNWFKHNHQKQGKGEPSILAGMTRAVIGSHVIDTRRVYVAGLSAGGAMAAIVAAAYPDLFAAAGVHSGLAPGAATDLPSALSAMRSGGIQQPARKGSGVPTIVFHGDSDVTVHPANAQGVIAASVGAAAPAETTRIAGLRGRRPSTKRVYRDSAGQVIAECWNVHGAGHAWAGGQAAGSYTDGAGPDATGEMLRFFFERTLSNKM